KTLASSAVKGIRTLMGHIEEKTPLRRNVTQEEVGNAAVFLCSELGSGATGAVIYVDTGYHAPAEERRGVCSRRSPGGTCVGGTIEASSRGSCAWRCSSERGREGSLLRS